MGSSKNFWIFSDAYCFFGFFTQILYNFVPAIFLFQLKYGVLKTERLNCIGILCLYGNAFIYFFVSIFHRKESEDIDPLDFCNLTGAYLGFVYMVLYFYFIYFKTNKRYALILIFTLSIVSGSIFLLIFQTVDSDENNNWVKFFNWIGVIFNVLENLPLGFNIVFLIKNKISEKFTLFGAFFGIINCSIWLAWAIYGVFNSGTQYHSIVANILGISMHIIQFFLFFKFRKDDEIEENNEDKGMKLNSTSDNLDNSGIKFEKINEINNNLKNQEENKEPDYIKEFI